MFGCTLQLNFYVNIFFQQLIFSSNIQLVLFLTHLEVVAKMEVPWLLVVID